MFPTTEAALRRRELLALAVTTAGAVLGSGCARTPAPHPRSAPGFGSNPASEQAVRFDARTLPRFRGFNLLDKFFFGNDQPYDEWDFDFLAEHDFNYVRLPTDYRCWTEAPGKYRDAPLVEIEQAVRWGQARGIHVNFALHRAPGYSVNRNPPEALDLWDEGPAGHEPRRQFLAQWRLLAERLADFPTSALSFNLLNEPADVTGPQYRTLVEPVIAAIRAISPGRVIFADGVEHGKKPVRELVDLGVVQSTRGYAPFQLTHYRADWVEGSDRWQVPTWPVKVRVNQYLFGAAKPELRTPLVLRGAFPAGVELALHVHQVSESARIVMSADGSPALERLLEPKEGAGDWKTSEYRPQWKSFQAVYDRTYRTKLARACTEIRVEVTDGDWLTFSKLTVGNLEIMPNDADWGKRQRTFEVTPEGELHAVGAPDTVDRERLYKETLEPWLTFSREHGVAIHVGEWGAHRYTPHAVVLAWMRDCLTNWERADLGWALWNLRGSFGCVDSERADVSYELYRGRKLDRRMLELLKAAPSLA